MARPTSRTLGYVAAWLVAATVAVVVGLVAVTGVGASVRDRGPLTGAEQAVRDAQVDEEGVAEPDPGATRQSGSFDGDYGTFDVTCQGAVAFGDAAEPATGWRVISYEQGPDDDVDATFASGDRSVELDVYCNSGVPTLSDREVNTLPDDD
ncbi:hypothetical protein [Nocardioides sp.]|uniref:hypothetical protein n=1 Tax=Nocardioides sp. TaxID=35761 RepID=UPI002719139B|nr:hypothetical protein [Nocardioides sp.]MDO9456808.1 hypothetical protein [Nocardioides sp.]